jgi:hypothetical protein
MSPASSKKTSCAFNTFIQSLPSAWALPSSLEGGKIITLSTSGRDPNLLQNLRPISLMSTTGKLYEKLILITIQEHIEERNRLIASQFGFRADHNKTFMRLADHAILNLKNNVSMAVIGYRENLRHNMAFWPTI